MSAPGLVPAWRYVRARVTFVDVREYAGKNVVYFEATNEGLADANNHPTYFAAHVALDDPEAPEVGKLVTFRVGPDVNDVDLVRRREPREHHVKADPEPFDAVGRGDKRHETRVDDRDYRVGDTLVLHEWARAEEHLSGGYYTGRELRQRITYKREGGTYGLPVGLCVLSIEPVVE